MAYEIIIKLFSDGIERNVTACAYTLEDALAIASAPYCGVRSISILRKS